MNTSQGFHLAARALPKSSGLRSSFRARHREWPQFPNPNVSGLTSRGVQRHRWGLVVVTGLRRKDQLLQLKRSHAWRRLRSLPLPGGVECFRSSPKGNGPKLVRLTLLVYAPVIPFIPPVGISGASVLHVWNQRSGLPLDGHPW